VERLLTHCTFEHKLFSRRSILPAGNLATPCRQRRDAVITADATTDAGKAYQT
jgi:hypothetical protein